MKSPDEDPLREGLGIRADHQGDHFPWEDGPAMGNPTVLGKIPNLRSKRR